MKGVRKGAGRMKGHSAWATREQTHHLQLLQRRLAHTALLEIGRRGGDNILDDLAVNVALRSPR